MALKNGCLVPDSIAEAQDYDEKDQAAHPIDRPGNRQAAWNLEDGIDHGLNRAAATVTQARPKRGPEVRSDPWGLSDHPAGNTASAAWADALAAAWGAIEKYPDQHETSWVCAHADSDGVAAHWLESGQVCPRPEPARAPYRGRVLLPPKLHEARAANGCDS